MIGLSIATGILLALRLFDRVSGSRDFVDLYTGESYDAYKARVYK